MKHTSWQKIISWFLIFFLLFSISFRLPFFEFFFRAFAWDLKYYDIVSILVEEDIYWRVKSKIERYAQDIEGVLENTRVVILPIPSDASAFKIASLNESLYFEWYKSLENVNFESRLVWSVFVWNIPLPIAFDNGKFSKTIFPFTDFEDKGYIYNNETSVYEKDATLSSEMKADIWHGFISPNTGNKWNDIQAINDYFDKNHDFYTGKGNFSSSLWVINGNKDDEIRKDYKPYVFYYDQIRENQAIDVSKYQGYLAYNDNLEDIVYKRYSKELAEKLKEYIITWNDEEVTSLIKKLWWDVTTSSTPDLTNSSDILSRYVSDATTKNFLEIFNEGTISDFRTFVHNAGRYNWTGSQVNADLIPFLVTVLDLVSAQVVKDANTRVEDYIDSLITNNNSRKIAIPTRIESNDVLPTSLLWNCGWIYVNFLYWKEAETITKASDCSIYRGSIANSWTLVEANRAYNIDNAQADLTLCSNDRNRDGKVDTSWYWWWNSPLNLNTNGFSEGKFFISSRNNKLSLTPLLDIAWSQQITDVSNTPSPLQCYENNFLLWERRESFIFWSCQTTYRIPNIWKAVNWNCATNNITYNYTEKFDDLYKKFSHLSLPLCTRHNLWLDGKIIKTEENVDETCLWLTKIVDYKYKSISSPIVHKSPTAEELWTQINSMITPSLPIDKVRYIDYIAPDGSYQKINYPQIFSFDWKDDIETYKDNLKKELDSFSSRYNTIIKNTDPNKLSWQNKEIYTLLKSWNFDATQIDIYDYLEAEKDSKYTKEGDTKSSNYIDSLAFSLYWKNLNSSSAKYKFIFENYLSDEFWWNDFNFHLSKNKKSYEIAYLWAPWDSQNMYIKLDPEEKITNPYSQVIANNTILNTSLLSYNITTSDNDNDEEDSFKCSPPDGVPIWEWVPAVICRLKDMLPPKISISDWECWENLLSEEEIEELDECDGDINKNAVNDCIETRLKAGSLNLESDSNRYYYNKSWTLRASIKDKNWKQATFDNSTQVKFQLQQIIVPESSKEEFSETNSKIVYESENETPQTRKEVSKYINFKNLTIKSDSWEADMLFSTKGKDADLYFQAFVDIKDKDWKSEVFLESEKIKVEIRGDRLFVNTYTLEKQDSSYNVSSWKNSIIASGNTNIYLVDGNKTSINDNSTALQNNSLASEKMVFSLFNYSKEGNNLQISYPISIELFKDNDTLVWNKIIIEKWQIDAFKWLFTLSEANDYTIKITDSFHNTFKKNFSILPSQAVKAQFTLWTSILEQGGVISTNAITLLDAFDNPTIWELYSIEATINWNSLVFNENEKEKLEFQTVEWYRAFRLKSKNSSGTNTLQFNVKDNTKKSLFSQNINIEVLKEIKLDIQPLQSEVKVWWEKYAYKIIARDSSWNKLSWLNSRAYIVVDPMYGTLDNAYTEIKNGEAVVYFKTKNLAGQNVKLEFQVEWVKLIVKRYIDILPEKPVKIDISLSKNKMEASKDEFSLASITLKDRYGNTVFTDNTSQIKIELLDKYKDIIRFDDLNKWVKKGKADFKIYWTDIPWRAYFKASVSPSISGNTFEIVWQWPFLKELLVIPWFTNNGTLTSVWTKFFEEVSSTLYKSKFSSLSSLQSSQAYKNISSSLQSELSDFWQETNKIIIVPLSENASSLETFYFWNKDKIEGNKYNGIYTTLLWASYWDITEENYLASSLLFDKENRSLAVTSLLNNPYKYSDIVSFASNWAIQKVYDTQDLSQNIKSSVSIDNDGLLKLSFQNSALWTFVAETYFNFDKNHTFLKKCVGEESNFNTCEFSKKETSIVLKSLDKNYGVNGDWGKISLKNSYGQEIFSMDKEGKIINNSDIYFILDESNKKLTQFLIKTSDKTIWILWINFVDMQVAKLKDNSLVSSYKNSLKNGIIFVIYSNLYSIREISNWKDISYFIYYNDPFANNFTLDTFSSDNLSSYENFSEDSGVWWKEWNKTLLSFASWKSVWEATKDYQSFSLINLWDPVIALKDIKKSLPWTNKERSFDSTIWKLVTAGWNVITYKILDYNFDDRQDLVVYKKDGYVDLYENEKTESRFKKLGHLAYLGDSVGKNIFETWDFTGDGYDDIFFVNNAWKAFLLNNVSKDFSRFSLESNFSLSWNIIRVRVFDMDNDGKDDIVTLDDSGEIHIFYGWGSSTSPRFTKLLVGNGYGLELNNEVKNNGGLIYFSSLYQMPQTPDNSSLLASNDAYLAQLQKNISSWADITNIYTINESYLDNLIFNQVSYTPVSLRNTKTNLWAINQSDISASYKESIDSLDTFINSNDNYIWHIDYYNSNQNTTFIKSEYAESQWVQVQKKYSDKNDGTLKVGDKVKVDVTLTNISWRNLSDFAYIENIESPFALEADFKFSSEDWLKATSAPAWYDFIVENFNIWPSSSIHFSYEMNTLSMKFLYLQVGLFEEGETWDDEYGDIIIKANEKNCWGMVDIYRSIAQRSYQKWQKSATCDSQQPTTGDYADTDNNGVPDYIDKLISWDQQSINDYANESKNTISEDGDDDWIPDSEDDLDDYNDEDGLDSLGDLSEAVDEISSQMDTIIEWFGCGFWWGSCFANPINWAPLAPWNDPTLMGMPIGDGLRVNEWIPIFSALTWLQMMCWHSPCCIPVVYPVSPLAYVPWPKCWKPSAWWYLGTWAPTNYVRLFVTPTLTWWVGTAICFGWPAMASWYANPPWLHPVVPWWNCVVAAMPLLWCEDDGSDGDVWSQWFSQTSANGSYDIIHWNCEETDSNSSVKSNTWSSSLDTSLVRDYVTYKKTWVKSKTLEERIEEMFSTVADNDSSYTSYWNDALINLEGGGSDDMSLSLDINTDALASWNISDVVQFSMKRVWAFPDFLMEWVTRQIEEIVTKLTDFPTLFVILPDFSGIMDSSWENLTEKVSEAFNEWKEKQEAIDKKNQSSLEKEKSNKEKYCSWETKDDVKCSQAKSKISRLQKKNTFSSQTISWINEVYQFLSQMPLVAIEPEIVSISIPWIDQTSIDKALIEWRITRDNWQEEIDTAKESWSMGALCNQEVESERQECQEDNAAKNKIILKADALITSLDRNIEVLEDYKDFPEKLNELISKKEERLEQILCNIDSISQMTWWRIEKNGKRFKTWVELYILIKAVLKSWQLLVDVFIDYDASCHQCKNERDDLLYYAFKIINMVIPKIPVIQFPKWPDIILDLHNIRAWMVIYMPEFKFNTRPFVIPSLPHLSLPTTPNVNISLPSLPILPTFEIPELPDLPSLPKIELPDLPPPPKLPKLFSSLEGIIDILKLVTKAMCILKSSPFVPEWRAWDQIAFITERNGYLSTDFLDLSLPQFSYPFVDAIKVTTYVNLEFDNEFIVEMVRQILTPLNSMTNNIVNLTDWNISNLNFSDQTPQDINIDINLDTKAKINQEKISTYWEKFIQNFAYNSVKNIVSLVKILDSEKNKELTASDFKYVIAQELAKDTIKNDPKLEKIRTLWQETLSYDFAQEDEIIKNLKQENKEKFATIKGIIKEEKDKTKAEMKELKNLGIGSPIKKVVSSDKKTTITSYQDRLQKYNYKFLSHANNLLEQNNTEANQMKKDAEKMLSTVKWWISSFQEKYQVSLSSKKLLSASITNSSTNTNSSSTNSCVTTGAKGQKYTYKGLYVVEDGVSYKLFDYTDQLKWDEEVTSIDYDNDWDEDLLYMVNGEIFLKTNTKKSWTKEYIDNSAFHINVWDNKFFDNKGAFIESINGFKETEVTDGYINLVFSPPKWKDISAFRVNFYDKVDKYTNLLDNTYAPENTKRYVVDAFAWIDEILKKEETETYTKYNNLWRISYIGRAPWITMQTKEFVNIGEDIAQNKVVNISSQTKIYSWKDWVRITYVESGQDITKSENYKHIYLEKYSSLQFKNLIRVISLDGDAYIQTGKMIEYQEQSIVNFIGMPLLPDTKIYVSDNTRLWDASTNLDITYYDDTKLSLDWRDVVSYEIYNLGAISDSYLIQLEKPNDYYYADIYNLRNDIIWNYSKQILLAPSRESDTYAPEIKLNSAIRIPVYQKQTFDLTSSIYENTWIKGIKDFYIDFDLTKDNNGDGNLKNDRDTDKINIIKTINSIKVEFGAYDTLFKKKIALIAKDQNDNTWYKEVDFEVYSPIPSIKNQQSWVINWFINEKLNQEPVNIYRYRGGIISKLLDTSWQQKVQTFSWGLYDFTPSLSKGLALKIDGKEVATINEYTWYIALKNPWYSFSVTPSSDTNIYPKISVQNNNGEIYYEYIQLSQEENIEVVDSFETITNKGIYVNFINKWDYNYYKVPAGVPINPEAMVIYGIDKWRNIPLFTILKDGRIYTYSSAYRLEYTSYDKNIVFKLIDSEKWNEVARVMYVINGNFMIQ